MLKKAGNLFTTAYLLLIFGVYPLYMNRGYVDIGEAKYQFFIYSSLAAAGILALIGVMLWVRNTCYRVKGNAALRIDWNCLSATDLFVIMYATGIFLSYTFSDYREEALWGAEGWYMGLVTLLTLCGLYFLVSRWWDGSKVVWYTAIMVSGIVFMFGILDRFSIYLIPLEVRQPSFISTLGNINWFCGYLSVLAPVGICRFLFYKKNWEKWIYGGYTVIAFMAGFCQGSSSIFLFWGALFYLLLWIAIKKRAWFGDYFLLLSLWGFSAQAVRLMRLIMPDRYNYDTDNLCAYLTDSNFMLLMGIGALIVYLYLWVKQKGCFSDSAWKSFHRIMLILLAGGILLWLTAAVLNTWAGIPGLEQANGLLLNDAWGNGRGAAIFSSLQMYREMPVLHKLFGAGPDCFSAYAYSLPEVSRRLGAAFGSSRLTNAHNELLTCLINTGVLGVCLYFGIFASFLRRCMGLGEKDTDFYIFSISIVCYFCHNMVSFAQVLNIPFLFLLLGMGEAQRRYNS